MQRRYDLHNDISIDPFIKSHLDNLYALNRKIDPNLRFAGERIAVRKALETSLRDSGANNVLERLEKDKNVHIQLLVLKDDENLPEFEHEEVRGHASDKFVTIFLRKGELCNISFIVGKIFHEIRARSHRPDQPLGEFESVNRRIEAEVRDNGFIVDSALREEFAQLDFPEHLEIIDRDYTATDNGDMVAFFDLDAIRASLNQVKREFPQIQKNLSSQRDDLSDEVIENLLSAYSYLNGIIRENRDITQRDMMELNTLVLVGKDFKKRLEYYNFVRESEHKFSKYINHIWKWYKRHENSDPWKRASGMYVRILGWPQLFVEGNHRTGMLISNFILLKARKDPFVLNKENAVEYFNLSSDIKFHGRGFRFGKLKFWKNERKETERLLKKYADSGYRKMVPIDMKGSPREALIAIYKKFGFEKFDKNSLYAIRRPYRPSTVDIEVRLLKKLGILVPAKKQPGYYMLNEVLRGATGAETDHTIETIYNIRFQVGRTKWPLGRYEIQQSKIPAVREQITMEIFNNSLRQGLKAKIDDKFIIKIWSGYAKSKDQKAVLQEIRKTLPGKGYEIDFGNIRDEEASLKELVDFAISHSGRLGNTVIILPLDHDYVQENLAELKKSRVIFMDYDSSGVNMESFFQIGGIIAAGVAYLNNNNFAFMKAYRLLTNDNEHPLVTIDELKRNPLCLKFLLTPIRIKDPDVLRHLNDRMRELLIAA